MIKTVIKLKMENLEITMNRYIKVKILEMKIITIMARITIMAKMKKMSRMRIILKLTNLNKKAMKTSLNLNLWRT
jgi:hypothetical protein